MKTPGVIRAFTYGGAGAIGAVFGLAVVTIAAGALASRAIDAKVTGVLDRIEDFLQPSRPVPFGNPCPVPGCLTIGAHDHAMEGHE